MGYEEAARHLTVARRQLDRVQTASWDPDDEDREDAVTWGFYSFENAVVAAAEKANLPWKRTHWDKLDLADKLHADGYVSVSVRNRMEELNELRKDVAYGEAGPDLNEYDLENLAVELEKFLDEVEKFVES
jgi:hypothetical protein